MASMATPMSRRLRVSFGPILASSAFPTFIESYRCFLLIFPISVRVSPFNSRHSYIRLDLEAEDQVFLFDIAARRETKAQMFTS